METLFSIIAALQPEEWITKIDLKDAYHHILHYTGEFSRTESRTYTIYSSTSSIVGLDNQLGKIIVTTHTNSGLISPPDSFLPTLTNVLSSLSPTTAMPARKISSIISRMSQCPIHIQQPSSPPVSPVLVQSPVVSSWMRTSSHTFAGFKDKMWWQVFHYIFRNPACSSSWMHLSRDGAPVGKTFRFLAYGQLRNHYVI